MASLKNIKSKIISTKKTSTVTRAMEAVSAVKMRKSQERALGARPYARAALRVLASVSADPDTRRHPLSEERKEGKVGIVIITSDKGLAGSLNSAVIKQCEQFINEENLTQNDVVFFCMGKRGYEFAERRGYAVVYHETNVGDGIDEREFRRLTDKVIEYHLSGATREIRVAYTNFRSTFEQEASMHKILPLSEKIVQAIVDSIIPEKGKYADAPKNGNGVSSYTVEPDAHEVLSEILPLLVNVAIFHKMLESKASEHSARMVAMKNATDKAKERVRDFTRLFNKIRQAAITREVSEITSGIEAMR